MNSCYWTVSNITNPCLCSCDGERAGGETHVWPGQRERASVWRRVDWRGRRDERRRWQRSVSVREFSEETYTTGAEHYWGNIMPLQSPPTTRGNGRICRISQAAPALGWFLHHADRGLTIRRFPRIWPASRRGSIQFLLKFTAESLMLNIDRPSLTSNFIFSINAKNMNAHLLE